MVKNNYQNHLNDNSDNYKAPVILLLSFEMPPYITGGIGSVAYETVKSFGKMGYEVIVIAPKNNRPSDFKVPYYSIPIRNNILKTCLMLMKAFIIVIKHRPTSIYSLSGTYSGLVAMIISKIFNIRYYVVAHGMEFIRFNNNFIFKRLIKQIYNYSSRVFAVSNFTKNNLIRFGVKENNIFVCYNGVNIDTYHVLSESEKTGFRKLKSISQNKFVLLTIARLDERKGHLNTLKALKNIFILKPELKSELIYLIGGKGPMYNTVEQFIKQNSLEENIKLLGFISEAEINKFYNICDLFIQPNIFIESDGNVEGFGLVFLEAAAAKKTSIGGIAGGSAEAIKHNLTGVTVNGDNIAEIEESILELFYNRGKLSQLAENAYLNATGDFNWNKIITGILTEMKLKVPLKE